MAISPQPAEIPTYVASREFARVIEQNEQLRAELTRLRRYPALKVGDTLYGFCGGAFGSNSYGNKHIVAIGEDWVVAREAGRPVFANCAPDDLAEYTEAADD